MSRASGKLLMHRMAGIKVFLAIPVILHDQRHSAMLSAEICPMGHLWSEKQKKKNLYSIYFEWL